MARLPAAFQFQKWQTHFCIAIRIAMPWDAMSAKRNETKRNGMEQNDDRRHSTSACSLQSAQLFALAPHIRFLFSPTLCPSHSLSPPFLLSCSFVPLGGNCSNLRARPLSTKKGKQVTNKKRVKIKKKYSSKKIAQPTETKGAPLVGGGGVACGLCSLCCV